MASQFPIFHLIKYQATEYRGKPLGKLSNTLGGRPLIVNIAQNTKKGSMVNRLKGAINLNSMLHLLWF